MNGGVVLTHVAFIIVCFTSLRAMSISGGPGRNAMGQNMALDDGQSIEDRQDYVDQWLNEVKRANFRPSRRRVDRYRFIYRGLGKRSDSGSVAKSSLRNDFLIKPYKSNIEDFQQQLVEKSVPKIRDFVSGEVDQSSSLLDAIRRSKIMNGVGFQDVISPEIIARTRLPIRAGIQRPNMESGADSQSTWIRDASNRDVNQMVSNLFNDDQRIRNSATKSDTRHFPETIRVDKKWWARNHLKQLRAPNKWRTVTRIDPAFYFLGLGK